MDKTASSANVASGDRIGRYNVLGKLATGGMAEVFLARQEGAMGFTKNVVLKRILPQYATDEEFLHMFLNEARLAALINHPNVVSIFELGEDPQSQSLFMAMEYIEGRNLKDVLKRAVNKGNELPVRLAARLIAEASAGLDFAHELRDQSGQPLHLVHRDISADNILVSYTGLVKVVDFGIAKAALTESRTKTGQVKGKFGYMAPEMLLGHPIDRRVDVWALGIVLYWLLTGKRPFRGESEGQLVNKVVNEPLPPMERAGSTVPPELEDIVKKALQKDPKQRYQTASELRSDLELWLSRTGEPVTTTSIAEVMEKLFPAGSDQERLAMQRILNGEKRDSGWSTPGGILTSSRSNSDVPPPSSPNLKATRGSDSLPVSQVLAGPRRIQNRLPVAVIASAVLGVTCGVGYFVWSTVHTSTKPPIEAPPKAASNDDSLPPIKKKKPKVGTEAKGTPLAVAPLTEPPPDPTLAAANIGKLVVDVRPWAIVFVDGERKGMTPLEPLSLSPGSHKVELQNDQVDADVVSIVTIKSGETKTLQKILGDANAD